MLRNLLKVSDDELAVSGTESEQEVKPHWMAQLSELGSTWLKQLPKVVCFTSSI